MGPRLTRSRLDQEMVRRGMVRSRAEARHLIREGRVHVAGVMRAKPASMIEPSEPIDIDEGPRYVSRAGAKLEAALTVMAVPVAGRRALDVGAAAGGFTDCLLQHGAAAVVAIDVGHGQFAPSLQNDPRVVWREGLDIRRATADQLGEPFPLVVADLAFISLRAVAPALAVWTVPGGDLILLVKPQFESESRRAGARVVSDPAARAHAVEEVSAAFSSLGFDTVQVMPSPVLGEHGNQEYLLWLRKTGE